MRITKTIREFVQQEVSVRLAPKYEEEKREAERQNKAMNNFYEGCANAAEEAFNAYFDEHFSEIAEFAEDTRKDSCVNFYVSHTASIRNRIRSDSVHCWHNRLWSEVGEVTRKIIVELELGGTKAELMEMLDKIGKE